MHRILVAALASFVCAGCWPSARTAGGAYYPANCALRVRLVDARVVAAPWEDDDCFHDGPTNFARTMFAYAHPDGSCVAVQALVLTRENELDTLGTHSSRYQGDTPSLDERPSSFDGHDAVETTFDSGGARTTILLVRPPAHVDHYGEPFVLAIVLSAASDVHAEHRDTFVSLARRIDFSPRSSNERFDGRANPP